MSSVELAGSWVKAKMADLGYLYCGQSPTSATVNTNGTGTLYVTGPEQWDGTQFHSRKWTTDPKRVVPEGCIFITVKGAGVGKIFPGVAAAIGRDIYAFEPREGISKKFVELALRASVNDVLRHAAGDIPGLSRAHILEHEISVPDFGDQERIVAEIEKQFSRLDEAVAGLQRVKANLKRYKAAVLKSAVTGRLVPTEADLARREGRNYETGTQLLQRILETRRSQWQGKGKYKEPAPPDTTDLPELPEGWGWANCDAAISQIDAGASFKCTEHEPEIGETGVLKVSAVTWGTFNEAESKTCNDPERIEESYLVRPGDFLFSRANTIDLVGACVIVGSVRKRLMLSDKTLRFTISDQVLAGWMQTCLRSKFGRDEIERLATGNQESMRNIGQERIRQIRLPLPPIVEQHRIVAEVDRLLSIAREAEAEVEANLKRTQGLRQAILSAAFKASEES